MTPTEILTIGLRRCGLTITSATFKSRGREYLNDIILMLQNIEGVEWVFLRKVGTLTLVASTRGYALASDVKVLKDRMRNTSNDNLIFLRTQESIDKMDPDQSSSGDPHSAVITGYDNTTGYLQVDLHPTPDTADTVKYNYEAQIPLVTASGTPNDETDLDLYLPRHLQGALYHGVAGKFLSEFSAYGAAREEYGMAKGIIDDAIIQNSKMIVQEKVVLGGESAQDIEFPVQMFFTSGSSVLSS